MLLVKKSWVPRWQGRVEAWLMTLRQVEERNMQIEDGSFDFVTLTIGKRTAT